MNRKNSGSYNKSYNKYNYNKYKYSPPTIKYFDQSGQYDNVEDFYTNLE